MEEQQLADIARGLYALPFDEFVAARTTAAKAAPTEAGRSLAAEVRSLPKPSVAAWAVNMLAAKSPDTIRQLIGLGRSMRSAQHSLDATALRDLGRERRRLLQSAVETARTVAEHQGRRISGPVAAEVEETLRAATADDGAAAAVGSGMLLRVLSANGVDVVDISDAVAVPSALRPAVSGPWDSRNAADAARAPDKPRLRAVGTERRANSPSARERATTVLAEAEKEAQSAVETAARREEQLEEVSAEMARLTAETRRLRATLRSFEEELELARRTYEVAAAEAKQAARAAEKGQRAAVLARERVLRMGNTPD